MPSATLPRRLPCLLWLVLLAACTTVSGLREESAGAARVYAGEVRPLADALLERVTPESRNRDGELALEEVEDAPADGPLELRAFEPSWTGGTLVLLISLVQQEPGLVRVELRGSGASATGRQAAQVWHWFNREAGPAVDPDALD